jgi:hypothetical protein
MCDQSRPTHQLTADRLQHLATKRLTRRQWAVRLQLETPVAQEARMSGIADYLGSASLRLCNESFASTNEREGSQIARGIVDAFAQAGSRWCSSLISTTSPAACTSATTRAYAFLRAERRDDGARTFRLIAAEPEPTSYGGIHSGGSFGDPPKQGLAPGLVS